MTFNLPHRIAYCVCICADCSCEMYSCPCAFHEDIWRSGGIAPCILNIEWPASSSDCSTSLEQIPVMN